MKVRQIVHKINTGIIQLPVYLRDGAYGKQRKLEQSEICGGHFMEENATFETISILRDRVIIHYSNR